MASVRGLKGRGVGIIGVLALTSVFFVATASRADAAVVVTVDPSTGLADGQPITITGSGFAPGASVGAAECSAAVAQSHNTIDCDLSNAPITQADGSGNAVIHLRAKVTINTGNGTVDCIAAADPCIIGMGDTSDLSNPEKQGGTTITFDPNAPPAPPPAVSLTPSDELIDKQQVAVYATGFIPGEFVNVVQCAAQNLDKNPCNESFGYPSGGGQADPTGAVAFGITVRRAVLVANERFDCASAVGACVVVVQAQGGPIGTAPLAFDPSVPLPPPPTLTVTPSAGLGDGEIVHVHGEGFASLAPINLLQCPSESSPFFGCYSNYGRFIQAGPDGSFTSSMEVQRSLQAFDQTGTPTPVDCAESAGRCLVTAFDYNDALDTAQVPVSFDPNKPPAPEPTATASPNTGLVDGQTVTISADHFPPGSNLFLVECVAGSTDGSQCDLSHLANPFVDDNGHVEAQYVVQRFINLGPPVIPPPPVTSVPAAASDGRPNAAAESFLHPSADPGTFDCASAPGACVLGFAFLGGPQIEFAGAPLTFDASAPPSTPTTAAPGPGQPSDATGDGDPATSSTAPPSSSSAPAAVSGEPLARTGTDIHSRLRFDLLLLVVGALTLVSAAALRARAHRRASANP